VVVVRAVYSGRLRGPSLGLSCLGSLGRAGRCCPLLPAWLLVGRLLVGRLLAILADLARALALRTHEIRICLALALLCPIRALGILIVAAVGPRGGLRQFTPLAREPAVLGHEAAVSEASLALAVRPVRAPIESIDAARLTLTTRGAAMLKHPLPVGLTVAMLSPLGTLAVRVRVVARGDITLHSHAAA